MSEWRVGWLRRVPLYLWLTAWAVWVALLIYPVRSLPTRCLLLAAAAGVLIGTIVLVPWRRWMRWTLIGSCVVVGIFAAWPGRPVDRQALQTAYLQRVHAYLNTKYSWGGEGFWGVDCSGLPRAALVEAELVLAVRSANPRLLREACWLWWHDASARDLMAGYLGQTTPVAGPAPLPQLDPDRLAPGDLLITADGGHLLIYTAVGTVIEADPGRLQVMELRVGRDRSPWLQLPLRAVRWQIVK